MGCVYLLYYLSDLSSPSVLLFFGVRGLLSGDALGTMWHWVSNPRSTQANHMLQS